MFREIREVKSNEKITNNTQNEYKFKAIKPETDMTAKEAKEFWDNEFKKLWAQN